MSQSIHATTPLMIGEPEAASRLPIPANLSSAGAAKRRQRCSWSALRMLTQNELARSIRCHVLDSRFGKKAISGGSSDTELKEPTAIPTGVPVSSLAVTTETPVGYWPRTRRKHCGSRGSAAASSVLTPAATGGVFASFPEAGDMTIAFQSANKPPGLPTWLLAPTVGDWSVNNNENSYDGSVLCMEA